MVKIGLFSIFTCVLLLGCIPKPPEINSFASYSNTDAFEIYKTSKSNTYQKKNVMFIAADKNIQKGFSDILKKTYNLDSPPRIEDIAFWHFIPHLKKIYNQIIRIPAEKVLYKNIITAFEYMESFKEPYDVIILSHGLPNYLSTGSGYFLSHKELKKLDGKLTNLNLVLLQSCYGESLSNDFQQAGARYVMAYNGLNQNYFFYDIFLKYYYPGSTVESAFILAKENFEFNLNQLIYSQAIDYLFFAMNDRLPTNNERSILISKMPLPGLIIKAKY